MLDPGKGYPLEGIVKFPRDGEEFRELQTTLERAVDHGPRPKDSLKTALEEEAEKLINSFNSGFEFGQEIWVINK